MVDGDLATCDGDSGNNFAINLKYGYFISVLNILGGPLTIAEAGGRLQVGIASFVDAAGCSE